MRQRAVWSLLILLFVGACSNDGSGGVGRTVDEDSYGGAGLNEEWQPPIDPKTTEEWHESVSEMIVSEGQLNDLFNLIGPLPVPLPMLTSEVTLTDWAVSTHSNTEVDSTFETDHAKGRPGDSMSVVLPELSVLLAVESPDSFDGLVDAFGGWIDDCVSKGWSNCSVLPLDENTSAFSVVRLNPGAEDPDPNNRHHSLERATVTVHERGTHRSIVVLVDDQVRIDDRVSRWVRSASSSFPTGEGWLSMNDESVGFSAEGRVMNFRSQYSTADSPAEIRQTVEAGQLDLAYVESDKDGIIWSRFAGSKEDAALEAFFVTSFGGVTYEYSFVVSD